MFCTACCILNIWFFQVFAFSFFLLFFFFKYIFIILWELDIIMSCGKSITLSRILSFSWCFSMLSKQAKATRAFKLGFGYYGIHFILIRVFMLCKMQMTKPATKDNKCSLRTSFSTHFNQRQIKRWRFTKIERNVFRCFCQPKQFCQSAGILGNKCISLLCFPL